MAATNTLLVVIDDDDNDSLLKRAACLASRLDSDIELFCCLYDAVVANERAFDSSDLAAAKRRRLQECIETLEELAVPLREQGHRVATRAVWDKPVYEGVVRRAMALNCRLVLRHRHFHSAIQRAVLSHDDWNLIRVCPAPLMITRPALHRHERQQIWAAVDPMHDHDKPAKLDRDILFAARELAQAVDGDLHVVHSYDTSFEIATIAMRKVSPVVPSVKQIVQDQHDRHLQRVRELVAEFALPDNRIHLAAGNLRKTLPALVIDNEVDVLVMGAVSRSRRKRALIGNSAEQVLDRIPCDLLVVKPSGFSSPVKPQSRHALDE